MTAHTWNVADQSEPSTQQYCSIIMNYNDVCVVQLASVLFTNNKVLYSMGRSPRPENSGKKKVLKKSRTIKDAETLAYISVQKTFPLLLFLYFTYFFPLTCYVSRFIVRSFSISTTPTNVNSHATYFMSGVKY